MPALLERHPALNCKQTNACTHVQPYACRCCWPLQNPPGVQDLQGTFSSNQVYMGGWTAQSVRAAVCMVAPRAPASGSSGVWVCVCVWRSALQSELRNTGAATSHAQMAVMQARYHVSSPHHPPFHPTSMQVIHLLHGHRLAGATQVVPGLFVGGEAAAEAEVLAARLQPQACVPGSSMAELQLRCRAMGHAVLPLPACGAAREPTAAAGHATCTADVGPAISTRARLARCIHGHAQAGRLPTLLEVPAASLAPARPPPPPA